MACPLLFPIQVGGTLAHVEDGRGSKDHFVNSKWKDQRARMPRLLFDEKVVVVTFTVGKGGCPTPTREGTGHTMGS